MKNLFLALSILLVANAYGQDSNMRKNYAPRRERRRPSPMELLMLISMAKAD